MSFEQAVVQLEQTNSKLQEEVVRFRDAAMGLNAIYPTVTEGRQAVADGKYFSVPGNGAYMRLYRRQGSSAELIAEFPDRNELNSVIAELGPLLGRGVTNGMNNLGSGGDLVRLIDAPFAARSDFGQYYPASSTIGNVDQARAGECALYSTNNLGTFPQGAGAFVWVETQQTYSNRSLWQRAVNYANTTNPNSTDLKVRSWKRICSGNTATEGERIWGAWVEDITTQNIVGDVTQGAVMTSGSNADGSYLKFHEGSMICQARVIFSYNTSSWQQYPTPQPFVGSFGLSWSFNSSQFENYKRWKSVAFSTIGINGFRGIYRLEGTTLTLDDVSEYIDVTMVGRWKE